MSTTARKGLRSLPYQAVRGAARATGEKRWVFLLFWVVACGGVAKKEVKEARASGYATDFARVYTVVLGVVQGLYSRLAREDAGVGVIETKWHALSIKQDAQGQFNQSRAQSASAPKRSQFSFSQRNVRTFFLLRYRVAVVGGNPWRVRIEGHAAKLDEGINSNLPVPLRGGDRPPWLDARTDSLRVAIHRKLKKYAVNLDKQLRDPDRDFPKKREVVKSFGKIAKAANQLIAKVRRAARGRQYRRLRNYMARGFIWNTGALPSAEQAIMMWQADGAWLSRLVAVIEAGCAQVEKYQCQAGGEVLSVAVLCPKDAVGREFAGERAVFARTSSNWRFFAFSKIE